MSFWCRPWSFLVPLGPLLASLLGLLWGLWGAQVGSSWLPKVSWTGSGLHNASLQNYHVLLCETTHSGLPGLPKTGQDGSTSASGGFQEDLEKELFSNYFLVSILCPLGVALGIFWGASGAPFGDPWRSKIGPKFDQKIIDNKNRSKRAPRDPKSPPGTSQGRPGTPQGQDW